MNEAGCKKERSDDFAEKVVQPSEEEEGPANAQSMRPDENPVEVAVVGRNGLRRARRDFGGSQPLLVHCGLRLRLHRRSFERISQCARRARAKRHTSAYTVSGTRAALPGGGVRMRCGRRGKRFRAAPAGRPSFYGWSSQGSARCGGLALGYSRILPPGGKGRRITVTFPRAAPQPQGGFPR